MKKYMKYMAFMVFIFFIFAVTVYAEDANIDVCTKADVLKTIRVAGYALFVLKIVVPILLMIFGMVDLFQTVLSGDADQLKKSVQMITKRAIAAVVIFLLPVIINFAFTLIDNYDHEKSKFEPCQKCLFYPGNC